jgi:4'-phosphopantetheinyl transferase
MQAIPALPSLRPWSRNALNQCTWETIPDIWRTNDIITFLADLGMYHPGQYDSLDDNEKERERNFRADYFKKRFILSRSLLKHILLPVLGAEDPSAVRVVREKGGRLILHNRPDIGISLSYSGPSVAITVAKQKIGSDIETVRLIDIRKTRSCPLLSDTSCKDEKERSRSFLHRWTLVEACAKLHDNNPLSLLNHSTLFRDTHFVSYCLDNHAILSLAFEKEHVTDSLVWFDGSAQGEKDQKSSFWNHARGSGLIMASGSNFSGIERCSKKEK